MRLSLEKGGVLGWTPSIVICQQIQCNIFGRLSLICAYRESPGHLQGLTCVYRYRCLSPCGQLSQIKYPVQVLALKFNLTHVEVGFGGQMVALQILLYRIFFVQSLFFFYVSIFHVTYSQTSEKIFNSSSCFSLTCLLYAMPYNLTIQLDFVVLKSHEKYPRR